MNGILVINKPQGMTSHDVVNRIRKIFKTKRVGHFGTLDPDACGVLVVGINDATKIAQFVEFDDKEYNATILIGKSTTTYDLSGEEIATFSCKHLDENNVDYCLNTFLGISKQLPPMYSAIKINGKKLYEYARKNEKIDVEPRSIEIKKIKRISPLQYNNNCCEFSFSTCVSKGTYIRSLCVDIGIKLGYPSLMKSLIRTRSGAFDISQANTLEEIDNGTYHLYSMLDILNQYPFFDDLVMQEKARHGMKISPKFVMDLINKLPKRIVIIKEENLIAIYDLNEEKTAYEAIRVWN